ncbi:MAG TPA: MG2 domain-containing protein, partial [Pyrinomonadaceae bacterium]|nr:MG2 domain-containing protein [Pyrinomonadaceae bacterium]
WIQQLTVAGRTPVKSWTKDIANSESHQPHAEQARIEGKLPVGAYLLEARNGSLRSRDIVLVSDATLVVKSATNQVLAFFADAVTGAPIPNATVALWESYSLNNKWHWRRLQQMTDSDGLARFTSSKVNDYRQFFAAAASNDRQAFASAYVPGRSSIDGWRIYAFTDRPAYRPKETLQWKFIARRSDNGVYSTPSHQVVKYEITDPRGTKVAEGRKTLNAFGSAWDSLELREDLPLGEYAVKFTDTAGSFIGGAKLFRLEEYKLPEFKVAVKTPEQDGKKKAFRLGERVEVEIQADYYFGGPVSSASVEVVVYQSPFYHYWFPRRDYAWYYADLEQHRGNYFYGASLIKRETIKTDATGKAKLTFDTPRENYNQDFEFRIEARVVDSSRREIIASDKVRVTRQRY